MLKPTPQCDRFRSGVFGKGIGDEGRALTNRIRVLVKGTAERSPIASTLRVHSEPGSRPHQKKLLTASTGTLDLLKPD